MFNVRFSGYLLLLVGFIQPSREQTTEDQRQKFLKFHNDLRDKIRKCELPGQPPAKAPYEPMVWDTAVEAQAQKWADKCLFSHGETDGVGQNIAIAGSVEVAVKLWADEYVNYDPESGECKPSGGCLHYTQMAWAASTKLGCGVKNCPNIGGTLYVCDYKPRGNYWGAKPYTAGTKEDCLKSTTSPPNSKPSGDGGMVGKPATDSTSTGGNLRQTSKMVAAAELIFILPVVF
ncbi:GLIPR1-like protein 1 [Clonorchis sinensis]|uniref:GLIPR1-like protein 1 n=1 Tax=Clonorchis sinensis TaxID=79923 RepID=G7Y4Q0_CLOSI|nr:GLIPR1-like protein 1 [Clonorchis sinensis]